MSSLGLTITGGVDTPSPGVIITDVKEGGAASIDGFLQVHSQQYRRQFIFNPLSTASSYLTLSLHPVHINFNPLSAARV